MKLTLATQSWLPAAEEATYIPIEEFIAHFHLTDDGEFKLQFLDSETEAAVSKQPIL